MSFFNANKLITIAENQLLVFNAGYAKGKAEGECRKTITSIIKPATCIETGEANFICEGCGAAGVTILPLIDHTYDENGICTFCGASDPYHINNYPIQEGLSGLFSFGGTEEQSLINYDKDSTNAPETMTNSKSGKIEYQDNWVYTSGHVGNHVATRVPADLNNGITWVVLFSVDTSNKRPLLGTRNGYSPSGEGLDLRNDGVQMCHDKNVQLHSFSTPLTSDNFMIIGMTATPEACRVVRYTNGTLNTDQPLLNYTGKIDRWTPSFMSNNKMYGDVRIGGDRTGDIYNPARIAMVALYNGIVSDEDLAKICDFMYVYGTRRGLTIE